MPALLTLAVLLNIWLNVNRVNTELDLDIFRERVSSYLRSERREASARVQDGELTIRYEYLYPRSQYDYFEKTIEFAPSSEDKTIYIYGSSPAVSRLPVIGGRSSAFPVILERKLNSVPQEPEFKVYNMAMTSADSEAIHEIIRATVAVKKPDLAVYFYEGGMDYEAAYHAAGIKEFFYPLKIISVKGLLKASGLDKNRTLTHWAGYLSWFNRCYFQPALLNFVQATGLMRVPAGSFKRVNAMITSDYKKNLDETVSFLASRDVPVVLVLNPDNLEAKPYGVYSVTEFYYDSAMGSGDPEDRLSLLKKARDSEIFTGDLGTRTEAYEAMKRLAKEGKKGVYVLDLAGELEQQGYPLGYESFYDYGHMKPALQEEVSSEIYEYLDSRGLLAGI
ncbi:MAG: hypothetical protein GF409_00250 [Candidatus Omnitrophica bacterium]|nr:hypothetical protein [Candidatus Omnitrophota bacterium]